MLRYILTLSPLIANRAMLAAFRYLDRPLYELENFKDDFNIDAELKQCFANNADVNTL